MKRFLSTVSLLLTIVMIVSMAAPLSVGATGTESEHSYGASAYYVLNDNTYGLDAYYAPIVSNTEANAVNPAVDGKLDENDPWYNKGITMTPSIYDKASSIKDAIANTKTTYYYSQDDNYIYVGIYYDLGTSADNLISKIGKHILYLGFDLNADVTSGSKIAEIVLEPTWRNCVLAADRDKTTGIADITTSVKTNSPAAAALINKVAGSRIGESGNILNSDSYFFAEAHDIYYELAIDKAEALKYLYGEGNTEGKTLNGLFVRDFTSSVYDKNGYVYSTESTNATWNTTFNGTNTGAISGIHSNGARAFSRYP